MIDGDDPHPPTPDTAAGTKDAGRGGAAEVIHGRGEDGREIAARAGVARFPEGTDKGTRDVVGPEITTADGRSLPLVSVKLRGEARGGIARLVLAQRFENPYREALHVMYRMPLPVDGAVSGYSFTLGDRTIAGRVKRKRDARDDFERAIAEGHPTALLEQERADIFTQSLGNLPARETLIARITIDLRLTWLPWGEWELRFPTVIGPRYAAATDRPVDLRGTGISVAPEGTGAGIEIAIAIRDELTAGREPRSSSHALTISRDRVVELRDPNIRLDRDIVVRWPVAGPTTEFSLAMARPGRGDDCYGLVAIVPPARTARAPRYPRDLILLIDTSGSMAGRPLDQAKQVLERAIDALGDGDQLELIAFSSRILHYKPAPMRASPDEKRAAIGWLRALPAGGGTEMATAVAEALRALRPDAQRQVVIATDGYIGNEAAIITRLHAGLPASCRLHFLGIGSSVNRALATAMARAGRGAEVLCDLDDDPERAASRLIERTRSPMLIDVTLEGSAVIATAPARLPDVYEASPVVAAVKLRPGELVVRGRTPAGEWRRSRRVDMPLPGEGSPGIVALYGREHVADLEARTHAGEDHDAAVERAGLDFQIATRLTALVAVDPDLTVRSARNRAVVPQELPYGTTAGAFGLQLAAEPNTGENAHGASPRSAATRGGPLPARPKRTMVGIGAGHAGIDTVAKTAKPDPRSPTTLAVAAPTSAPSRMPRGTPQHAPPGAPSPRGTPLVVPPLDARSSVASPRSSAQHAQPPQAPKQQAAAPPLPQPAEQARRARTPSSAPSQGFGQSRDQSWEKLGTGGTTAVHATSTAPHPGVRVNQYELIKMIGEDGMGSVYLARDLRLGRRVAIKFLHSSQPELTRRFLVEARITARCQHDNIVVFYDVGEHDGAPYIVLEYLDGKPLGHVIENGQKLPYTRAVEIMCSILRALQCAHEQGIVHRDLKPDNIFITESGTIKVLDFGIAKVLQLQTPEPSGGPRMPGPRRRAGARTSPPAGGAALGTLTYMSPEQWDIGIEVDHLTDLWACGILLHRMICGRHPLHPLDASQLIVTAMLELPMPSMVEAAPTDVPRELIQIVDRCLRKIKEQRWQSAAQLLSALEVFLPGRRTPTLQIDESPYAGLSSFQDRDAGKFFGRNREIAAMVTRIRDRPLIAVVGSSGVGKSSFVRAGLVPALARSGETWETLVVRPGRKPLEALAGIIAPMSGVAVNLADEVDEQHRRVDQLRREPGHLGDLMRLRARRDGRRILLFVDQFEELYTLATDPDERAAFTACLSAVADDATSPLRVVLAIRSDFLDRVAEDQQFIGELSQGVFFLGPPDRDGLREAITRPAEMAGFQFELSAIVDDMLDHLEATPGALPLLQFTAARLWETRDVDRKLLTRHSYAEMRGVAGALACQADRAVAELGAHKAGLVRALLLRLVTAERTRAIVALAELREVGEVQRVIDQMVDARLLVVQAVEGGKGSTVEIVHESLIQGWPTLRRWLDENEDDAALVDQLRVAARQWQVKNFDAGLLWRGDSAAEARKFRTRYTGPLSEVERSFLDAVIHHAATHARRRRTAITLGFVTLSMIAIVNIALLLILHSSRAAAEDSAAAALVQQGLAEARLAEQEQADRAREAARAAQSAAEHEAGAVSREMAAVSGELARSREQLIQERDNASDNALAAERAQRRAEDNARKAARSEDDAVAAREAAAQANRALQKAIDKERDRIIQLENSMSSKPITELRPFYPVRRPEPRP